MTDTTLDELDVITAASYAEHGYPHDAWARLRAEDPVHRFAPEGYRPFWAITTAADITEVSRQPERFKSAGRFILIPDPPGFDPGAFDDNPPLRMLVNQDPPEHRDFRKLVSSWFTPRAIAQLEARLDDITAVLWDQLAERADGDGWVRADFVRDVAARQPLRMITEILGIPDEREEFVLRITNQNFGLEDPEFMLDGESVQEALAFIGEAFAYFDELLDERRADPRDDLSSVLAAAEIDGEPVPRFELYSLLFLVMVAGHDTTRNAISGGLLALHDHPDQLAALRRDPGLLATGADEIVRWTTPVNHFVRTATADYELHGTQIRAGDHLALFYASANRDEAVFDDPYAFRLDRSPNPHLGFGIGEHYCLGAHLARLDLKVFWRHFVERIEAFELDGPVELLASSFVGGPKHIPIRLKIRP
ncbi:MAG: cytochrome P450 [Acidimicrobiales bacterium]|nr:cytochrome P450 [Acidimicrobiales bacterium]